MPPKNKEKKEMERRIIHHLLKKDIEGILQYIRQFCKAYNQLNKTEIPLSKIKQMEKYFDKDRFASAEKAVIE